MIGQALVIAWSFTLSNLGTTPQVIDLGTAPTNAEYVPVAAVIKNAPTAQQGGDNNNRLQISFANSVKGTDPVDPTNIGIIGLNIMPSRVIFPNTIYPRFVDELIQGASAGKDLYVRYWTTANIQKQQNPVQVDILAYPTDNDLYCPATIIGTNNGPIGIPTGFNITYGTTTPGETYHFTAANIATTKQAIGTCQYKSSDGNQLRLGIKMNVTADRESSNSKWKFVSYQYLGCFHHSINCPFLQG